MDDYLTVAEVAASRGINHKTVRKAIRDGRIRAENWGSVSRPMYRIHADELEKLACRPAVGADVSSPSGRSGRVPRRQTRFPA